MQLDLRPKPYALNPDLSHLQVGDVLSLRQPSFWLLGCDHHHLARVLSLPYGPGWQRHLHKRRDQPMAGLNMMILRPLHD